MTTTTNVTGTDFVMVPVTDLPRAEHFYGEVLGLPRGGKWGEIGTEFETGTLTLAVADLAKIGREFKAGSGAIALRVDDVAQARAGLEAQAVTVHGHTIDRGGCHPRTF